MNDFRNVVLKETLLKFTQQTFAISKTKRFQFDNIPNPFLYLCNFWLTDPINEQEDFYSESKEFLSINGFEGSQIEKDLNLILKNDEFFGTAFTLPIVLADFLGEYFVNSLAFLNRENSEFSETDFEERFIAFSEFVFKNPVKKYVISHLFNFEAEIDEIKYLTFDVRKLERHNLDNIIGDLSFSYFLHLGLVGNYFLIIESDIVTNQSSPLDWAFEEINKADFFAWVLQYFKDGLVFVDYSITYYVPDWVNKIRRNHFPYIIGEPYRFPYAEGKKPYFISKIESEFLKEWVKIYEHPKIKQRAEETTAKIRQAILRASEFYQSSHKQKDEAERLIHLAVALEALFSPDDKQELSFRIRQNASQFIGKNAEERKDIFKFLKDIYSLRSKVVHGSFDINKFYDGELIPIEKNEKLASIVRKSLLGFFILYLKGENKREDLLNLLDESALDNSLAEKLRQDSDVDLFIKDTIEKYFSSDEIIVD